MVRHQTLGLKLFKHTQIQSFWFGKKNYMCPRAFEPMAQVVFWLGMFLLLWCGLSCLPAGTRKLHRLIVCTDLRCVREKGLKPGNAITRQCQPCFICRVCARILIMSRTAFICLQWDSLVKFPSCCIPKSPFYGNKSHFIHLLPALVTATGQQTINLDWFMDGTMVCPHPWKQIDQKTR